MTDFNEQDIERLSAYLDGMLSEAERLEVEALLRSADSPYQAELTSLQNTVKLVQALPTLKAPRSFALTREMAGLPPVQAKPTARRTQQINFYAMSFLSAAASFIMLVLATVLWASNSSDSQMMIGSVASAPTEITQQSIAPPSSSGAGGSADIELSETDDLTSEFDEGTILGANVRNANLPTFDGSLLDTTADAPSVETNYSEASASMPPAPFPDTSVEEYSAEVQAPMSAYEATEQTEEMAMDAETAETMMMRSAESNDTTDEPPALLGNAVGSIQAESEPEQEDLSIEEIAQVEEALIIEEVSASDEGQPTQQAEPVSAEFPAIAVVFLLLGGLFALMAITGIYWARKVRATA